MCKAAWAVKKPEKKEVERNITSTLDVLALDRRSLSATQRQKNSAKDFRASAIAAGVLGICILVFFAVVVIVPDLPKMRADMTRSRQR